MNHPAIYTAQPNPWLLKRLQKQFKSHTSLVIGVDFDHTIKCPITGTIYTNIVNLVKQAFAQGHTICIWTANQHPDEVKKVLAAHLIHYHYYNDSPISYSSRKAHFNLLLDDAAGLNEAYNTLNHFLEETA